MLAEPVVFTPVDEASFRRGYRAGFLVAIATFEGILRGDVHDALSAHAASGPLSAWAETDDYTDQTPPPPVRIGGITFGSDQ